MNSDTLDRFKSIVGERHALVEAADIAPYTTDMRGRYKETAPLVLRPGTVEEASQIVKLACETQTAIIPQGGNTGLVGAGLPLAGKALGEVVVSMGRMNRIVDVDPDTNTMTVESGCILQSIQDTHRPHRCSPG